MTTTHLDRHSHSVTHSAPDDFVDTIDPEAVRRSRPARLDLREPRLSTPAQLEAMAGPEPMLPGPDWVENLLWAIFAVIVVAAIGLAIGVLWEPIQAAAKLFMGMAGLSGLG